MWASAALSLADDAHADQAADIATPSGSTDVIELDADDFAEDTGLESFLNVTIFNVPSLVANLVVSGAPIASLRTVVLTGSARFVGRQLAPIGPTFRLMDGDVVPYEDPTTSRTRTRCSTSACG